MVIQGDSVITADQAAPIEGDQSPDGSVDSPDVSGGHGRPADVVSGGGFSHVFFCMINQPS